MNKKWFLLMMVLAMAFWPWIVIGLPLALTFTPCQLVRIWLGFSSSLSVVLFGIADVVLSYAIFSLLAYVGLMYLFKTLPKKAWPVF